MEFPPHFLRRMRRLLGEEAYQAFLSGYAHPLKKGLRVNSLKCDTARFVSLFEAPLTPAPFCDDSFYLTAPHKAGSDPLHHAGAYYMQEPSAASAVTVLAPQKGEHILDLCAAPGGKSTQIAAALDGTGLLWCNEYVRARAQVLLQNIERLGVRNAVVSNADSGTLCTQLAGAFDAVLVDAPCSGEGMFRKEPAALTQWSEALIRQCARRGADILDHAACALRRGGRLVYSTCTFAPEENEGQIARFLQTHPDFHLADCKVSFGQRGLSAEAVQPFVPDVPCGNIPLEYCRRIFPKDGGEGHFIALLIKEGQEERRAIPYAYPRTDERLQRAQALLEDCFTAPPIGRLAAFHDTIRLLPEELPAFTGISVLSAGIAVGTVAKNRIEPHHALFSCAHPNDCRRILSLQKNDPRVAAFLHGEEIPAETENGFAAVAFEDICCGFGKVSGGVLKNRYPKGLRR